MPHRIGNLYIRMCDKEIIRATIIGGTKGKRKRRDVARVLGDIDGYVDRCYDMLIRRAYVPTPPKAIEIYDSTCLKKRVIEIVPYYPDGLMHQLCVGAMKDVLMRGMYHWSCASIPGRGSRRAREYVRRSLDRDAKGTKYCLKMDIRKYYPSINIESVMKALERKIKDREFLKVVRDIISSGTQGGLSIGFYINQWLANYLLEPLDRMICTLSGVKHFVRNMDDMVIFGPNKRKLRRARETIGGYLREKLGLELKGNWQVFPVDKRGVDFIGYRFFHDRTILRKRNFLRFRRQCGRIGKKIDAKKPISFLEASGLISRAGQLIHCDGVMIRRKYLAPIGIKRLKEVVKQWSRRNSVELTAYRSAVPPRRGAGGYNTAALQGSGA